MRTAASSLKASVDFDPVQARQVQEKCREQHQDLLMVFIDLPKAFDSVDSTASGRQILLSWLHSYIRCQS